jgi:outer membrane protein
MRNLSICCALLVLAVVSMQTSAQSLKIGYVNVTRIESESAMAQQSIEKLKKEFAPREQQLQVMQKQGIELQTDLEKNGATMAASEREAKEKRLGVMAQQYQQAQRSLLEDVEVRKRESLADFLADVNVIIKGLAEAGKYDLIIQQSVYNSAQVDITEQVLAEIAKRSGGARK